ncbi:DUF2325 domain-containing protein (plasmid) [Rossellomorea sp. AcN35-11]|nr:DUF2325 domain-containing protein [Rossellomorea aquimaris]WJV32081.1 DUF2325 domain-containing protein [Rossellomorea sp. AcN35-11]
MQLYTENEIELLNEFMDLFEGEKEINEETHEKARTTINKFWQGLNYSLKDLMDFGLTSQFITEAPIDMVRHFFSKINVIITKKDIKRGKKHVLQRCLRKYHKQQIRDHLLKMFYSQHEDSIFSLAKDSSLKKLEHEIDTYGFHRVLWVAYTLEDKNIELTKTLRDEFPKDYTHALIYYYRIYQSMNFQEVMESPEELDKGTTPNPYEILKENKRIKSKMDRATKQRQGLKKEVYELQQENKQMRSEIHDLYEESLVEIERLKEESKLQLNEFQSEREMLTDLIQHLTDKNTKLQDQLKSQKEETTLSLEGKDICFVGGSKERFYREAVEKYGGTFHFVPVDDYNLIRGAVGKSDIVFFLKDIVKHKHFKETFSAAKDFDVPFCYLNSKGYNNFENELLNYMLTLEESS